MRTVWKFKLQPHSSIEGVEMPRGAWLLSAAALFNTPCVWAEVETGADNEMRHFELFETGEQLPPTGDLRYVFVGTVLLDGGSYVLHVYERQAY